MRRPAECQHLTVRVSRRALLEALAAKLRRRPRKDLQFDLEISMDSDFARAWCELVAHICHVSATAPAALANEGVRKQYPRSLMEIMLSAAPHSHAETGAVHLRHVKQFADVKRCLCTQVEMSMPYSRRRFVQTTSSAPRKTPASIDVCSALTASLERKEDDAW
jgi:hypothetical protein